MKFFNFEFNKVYSQIPVIITNKIELQYIPLAGVCPFRKTVFKRTKLVLK